MVYHDDMFLLLFITRYQLIIETIIYFYYCLFFVIGNIDTGVHWTMPMKRPNADTSDCQNYFRETNVNRASEIFKRHHVYRVRTKV